MEEHGKKFRRPCKKSGNVGSMEEAVEEEKLKNIFSFIFQNFLEEWKKLGKNSEGLVKTLAMLEERKKL